MVTTMNPVLTAQEITKYFHDTKAVDHISFCLYPGEIFGFLGPNGAGKSTTIKIVSGLLAPDSGKITTQDSTSIGLCPQEIVIWDGLTCLEQLQFTGVMHGLSPKAALNKANDLLCQLGLEAKRNHLAQTLSGGMQRRLNLALALIHSPRILLLDEHQAGLDPQSRLLVREYLTSLKKDMAIILTTHDMEEAEKLSDRICIIDYGRILVSGTVDEVLKSTGEGSRFELTIDGDIKTCLLPHLKNYSWLPLVKQTSPNTIHINSDDGSIINEILHATSLHHISITNLALRKTSLEDIFIHLTGRRLRE